jgi:hypothetical protein
MEEPASAAPTGEPAVQDLAADAVQEPSAPAHLDIITISNVVRVRRRRRMPN